MQEVSAVAQNCVLVFIFSPWCWLSITLPGSRFQPFLTFLIKGLQTTAHGPDVAQHPFLFDEGVLAHSHTHLFTYSVAVLFYRDWVVMMETISTNPEYLLPGPLLEKFTDPCFRWKNCCHPTVLLCGVSDVKVCWRGRVCIKGLKGLVFLLTSWRTLGRSLRYFWDLSFINKMGTKNNAYLTGWPFLLPFSLTGCDSTLDIRAGPPFIWEHYCCYFLS